MTADERDKAFEEWFASSECMVTDTQSNNLKRCWNAACEVAKEKMYALHENVNEAWFKVAESQKIRMPEKKTDHFRIVIEDTAACGQKLGFAEGFNAAIDEIKKLNGIKET